MNIKSNILIISIIFMRILNNNALAQGLNQQQQQLLDDSTNYANQQNGNANAQALQQTVTIPPVNSAQQQKLQSYQNNPCQMQNDGSQAITNSGTTDFFIKGRSQYQFTQNDPFFQQADATRNNPNSQCTSQTTTTTGTQTGQKNVFETCEVFRNYDMQSCAITQSVTSNCAFSSNNLYNRNSLDKIRLDIACQGQNDINVTVDAWGQKGKCAGPVTSTINLNTLQPGWTSFATLSPHWQGSCVALDASYNGGCAISCSSGNCTETCDYDFKFQNGYYNQTFNFQFSRLTFNKTNNCQWYEDCELNGNCGNYQSGQLYTQTCQDLNCPTVNGQQLCSTCFDLKKEYALLYTQDTCQTFISQGCGQIGSKCIEWDSNGACTLIENEFDCAQAYQNHVVTGGSGSFNCSQQIPCVGASCFDTSYQASPDFKDGVTNLNIADEMAQDIDTTGQIVFKGINQQCSKWLLGSKSCCASDKGFLFGCSLDEENLAYSRSKKVTHFVGSYCAKKTLFGVCLNKKESYCTYNSILSRIIQEQGRSQIGKGWGSAQNSDCSGFTLQEIQSLDFESMNFSDFIAEMKYQKNPDLSYDPNTFTGNP